MAGACGRTDHADVPRPGALAFATTTTHAGSPLAGRDGGKGESAQGSPPSSSSGMQLTWDGHVRLVCV